MMLTTEKREDDAGARPRQQCRPALRVPKKKMQREGLFRDMKERRAYEKPSERRVREKAQAISRHRKAARRKRQREGLIAAPKRKASAR